ncbi:hypothetical protein [Magnetococcus marinus]|nr:hypothetical protein [Magnetococcus marinus]
MAVWFLWERGANKPSAPPPPPPQPRRENPKQTVLPPEPKPEPKPKAAPATVTVEAVAEPDIEPIPASPPVAEPCVTPTAEAVPEKEAPPPITPTKPLVEKTVEPVTEPLVEKTVEPVTEPISVAQPKSRANDQKNALSEAKELMLPILSDKYDKSYQGKNPLDENVESRMNPAQQICSCADFVQNRKDYPLGDIRRVCACQALKLTQIRAKSCYEPLVWCAIIGGKQRDLSHFYQTDLLGDPAGIGFIPGGSVVALHTRAPKRGDDQGHATGDYKVFEYDLSSREWLEPAPPIHLAEVAQPMLDDLFNTH